MKNPKDLFPSCLKATHRKPITAEPRTATTADAISELGRGKNRSKTMPIRGAAMTIDVSENFLEGNEKSSPKDPEGDSPLQS